MPIPRATPVHTYRQFSRPIGGYPVNGKFSVVVPAGTLTNLVNNPSLETNTTNHNAHGSSTIARTTDEQRRGAYSLKVTPSAGTQDGWFFGTISTQPRQWHTVSLDFFGAGGIPYRFYVASTVNNAISRFVSFKGKGYWERLVVTFWEPAATSQSRRIYLTKEFSSSMAPFYIDGLLATQTAYEVSYFDGDTRGFTPGRTDFYWNGTPHGSTSAMGAQTRAAGRIVPLAQYGFTLLAIIGLGMTPPLNISTPLALVGGSQYQRTVPQDRVFDLVGAITSKSGRAELDAKRAELIEALSSESLDIDQPLLLQYVPTDDCGKEVGERLDIVCSYESGLEGAVTNHFQDDLDIRFRIYMPYVAKLSGDQGYSLPYQQSLSVARFAHRVDGSWFGLELNSDVQAMIVLRDGRVLVGGAFTNAGGDANADFLALYDPLTRLFSSVNATPLNAAVMSLAQLSNGNILVGGLFTNAGGDANADYLCQLNITTLAYQAVNTTPLNERVLAIQPLSNGNILIGGLFTNAGGDANADFFASVSGTTFAYSSLNATPLNARVTSITLGLDGLAYIGGHFTNAGGDANADYFARINSSNAFVSVNSTPFDGVIHVVETLADGTILIGGDFLNAGSTSISYLAQFKGTSFLPVGIGGGVNLSVYSITTNEKDTIIGGSFTTADGITSGSVAFYNGQALYVQDIQNIVSGQVNAAVFLPGGDIIVGGLFTSSTTARVTVVNNAGSTNVYPKFKITGPGELYQIKNYSTGRAIYFDLTLLSGEIVILDVENGTFTSNFRGNILSAIIPGSNISTFVLQPGDNRLSLFIGATVTAQTDSFVWWTPAYSSIDSAPRLPSILQ